MEISLIYDQWSWREKVARDVCSVMYINMTCTQNAYNAYNLLCTWSRYSHIKTALYLLISYGWMHYLHMHYATMQLTVEKCKWKKSLKTQVKMRIRWWAHIHNLAYFSNTLATIVSAWQWKWGSFIHRIYFSLSQRSTLHTFFSSVYTNEDVFSVSMFVLSENDKSRNCDCLIYFTM